MTDPEGMAVLVGAALAMSEPATGSGTVTVAVQHPAWLEALEWGRDHLGCAVLDFLCGVDGSDAGTTGITVVAHLRSPAVRHHLLLCALLPGDDLQLPTATGLFRGADRHERETYRLFGVVFTGHPNLDPQLSDGFGCRPLSPSPLPGVSRR